MSMDKLFDGSDAHLLQGASMSTQMPSTDLWAIHIQGPDDLFAMPSKEAAESNASILNAEFRARKIERGDNYPTTTVAVIPWPGSVESHARNMKEFLEDKA